MGLIESMMGRAGEQFATTTKNPTELLATDWPVQATEVFTRCLGNLRNCNLESVLALYRRPFAFNVQVTDVPGLVNDGQLAGLLEGFIRKEKSIPDVWMCLWIFSPQWGLSIV